MFSELERNGDVRQISWVTAHSLQKQIQKRGRFGTRLRYFLSRDTGYLILTLLVGNRSSQRDLNRDAGKKLIDEGFQSVTDQPIDCLPFVHKPAQRNLPLGGDVFGKGGKRCVGGMGNDGNFGAFG